MQVQKPLQGQQINWAHPLAKGIVGFWLMNEGMGDKVNDLSGNGNHGALINGPTWGPGGDGSVVEFDGGDDQIYLSNTITVQQGTIALRVYPHDISSYHLMIGTNAAKNYLGFATESGTLVLQDDDTNNVYWDYAFSTNQWWHIALTSDEVNWKLYVNGVYDDQQTYNSQLLINRIGQGFHNDLNLFDGLISVVSIYNRALTASEVSQLYSDPYAMFVPSFSPALLYQAPVGGVAPTSVFYGPLVGPMGGPV